MAGDNVDCHLHAIFLDHQFVARSLAKQPAGYGFEPFEAAHLDIGAFVNALAAGGLVQRVGDGVTPLVGPHRGQLHHHVVAVAIRNHAGQAVGFGVDQAQPLLTGQLRQGRQSRQQYPGDRGLVRPDGGAPEPRHDTVGLFASCPVGATG